MANALFESNIPEAKLKYRGKVRDVYELGEYLMLVATDRLSAFDVVLPDPIASKGQILTQISNFWFSKFESLMENHLVSTTAVGFIRDKASLAQLDRRTVVCRKAEPLPIEVIVRGYMAGSGWAEYCKTQTVCGIRMLAGLKNASRLPKPVFTPSTKAPQGQHDENISPEQAGKIIGTDLARQVEKLALQLYKEGSEHAATQGIILADTKFEFGMLDNRLVLIDEVMTPDSSRFWPADKWEEGTNPPSFDKQFVRDHLIAAGWDKKPPAPNLPRRVLEKTRSKYIEAYDRITGKHWKD